MPGSDQERDWALGRSARLLDMLNHDFNSGWMNDWDYFNEAQAEEDLRPGVTITSVEELPNEVVTVHPDTEPCGLNEDEARKCQAILRKYVDSWLEAGCDLSKWTLRDRFVKVMNQRPARLYGRRDGGAAISFSSPQGDRPESWAVHLFVLYLTSEHFIGIGRCARPGCGEYFLKESRRKNRKYCSDRCNKYASSITFTKRARVQLREKKLIQIREAINEFNSLKPEQQAKHVKKRTGWQGWVVEKVNKQLPRTSELRLTLNFVSRAANAGDVQPTDKKEGR